MSKRALSRAVAGVLGAVASIALAGCGQGAVVSSNLPLKRVVIYRNGVAYFERAGHVEEDEVRFKMKKTEVGDFLSSLAVIERGGSSVRSAAFPLNRPKKGEKEKPEYKKTEDEKKGLEQVVLALDGKAHDLEIGYVAEAPVWRPSYRLVVEDGGKAYLQAWGIVQNLSGEDWHDVQLSLVAGAPLAFEAQLAKPVIPQRPIVTDEGEVIAAVPHGDTSLGQGEPDRDADGIPDEEDRCPDMRGGVDGCARIVSDETVKGETEASFADDKQDQAAGAPASKTVATGRAEAKPSPAPGAPRDAPAPASPPPPPPPPRITAPRNLRSLAAVAVEAGATRYDLPQTVTVPDKSATMVLLLSKSVRGEALFLFAPDGGVPDSSSHPFRVARFANETAGVLERGPIAVFEKSSFLGQGMLDPLPSKATATVPFALERSLAVDQNVKADELGARVAKIENAELTIERDYVRVTKYRVRNGGSEEAKILIRHPRLQGSRLFEPPPNTEDNVGTQTALVPGRVKANATTEIPVDERQTFTRREDWFTPVADAAVKAYVADPRADKGVAAKLTAVWGVRKDIVDRTEDRVKLAREQATLQQQTRETRANLKAIEKNATAGQLRAKLTQRLAETSARLDEITKRVVETDAKLAELRIQFKEGLRDVTVTKPLPVK
jgi:hypothetical protein